MLELFVPTSHFYTFQPQNSTIVKWPISIIRAELPVNKCTVCRVVHKTWELETLMVEEVRSCCNPRPDSRHCPPARVRSSVVGPAVASIAGDRGVVFRDTSEWSLWGHSVILRHGSLQRWGLLTVSDILLQRRPRFRNCWIILKIEERKSCQRLLSCPGLAHHLPLKVWPFS